jgi:hypothetical protein
MRTFLANRPAQRYHSPTVKKLYNLINPLYADQRPALTRVAPPASDMQTERRRGVECSALAHHTRDESSLLMLFR